jgi:hypothetical protein
VAVDPAVMTSWLEPDLDTLFDSQCLARQFSMFGRDFFVHHLLLASGEVYDLHVQQADRKFTPAQRLILGCRDPDLRARLEQHDDEIDLAPLPAIPSTVQQLVESYWYEAHKHRKVLHRGLDLVAIVGVRMLHTWLLRLWHILATGDDPGDLRRATIHGLTPVAKALEQAFSDQIPGTIGLPTRTTDEICAAIDALNGRMVEIGRQLAARYDFDYPAELEAVVLRSWEEFKSSQTGGCLPWRAGQGKLTG